MVAADLPSPSPLLSTLSQFGYLDPNTISPALENLDAQLSLLLERLLHDFSQISDRSRDLDLTVHELTSQLEQERHKVHELTESNLKLAQENRSLSAQIEQQGTKPDDGQHGVGELKGLHSSAEEEERLQQWRAQSLHQLQELERMNQALRAALSRRTCCPTTESTAAKEKPCGGHITLSQVLAPLDGTCSTDNEAVTVRQEEMDSYRSCEKQCKTMEEIEVFKEKYMALQKTLQLTKEELSAKNEEIERLSSLIKTSKSLKTGKGDKTDEPQKETDVCARKREIVTAQKVENWQLKMEKLQASVQERECMIVSLRSELAQKVEQLAFITDEKVVGEEALGASQLECSQLASLIKEMDERMEQLTTALTSRTTERDHAISAENRETEARQIAEEGLRKKCNELLSELQEALEQRTRIQIELDESRRKEEEERSQHTRTMSELQKCQKQLDLSNKDTEQLKRLITQLDLTREELVGKLKVTMADQHLAEKRGASLEIELRRLAEEAEVRNTDLTQLHMMLEALGKERDHLHAEMQLQAEKLSQLNDENNRIVAEGRNLRRNLQTAEQKLHSENLLLQKSESEILSLKEKLCVEENSRKAAEDRCATKAGELQTVADDLSIVTCNLQMVKNELMQVVTEKENLLEDLNNLTSRLNYFEQLICVMENEEKALANSYDQLVEEHQQLKLAAIELDAQAQQQSYQLESMEELLQNTQEQSNFHEEECRKLKIDLKELEKQADVTSRSLGQQETLLESLHKEKAVLIAQLSSLKQRIFDMEKKNATFTKELATSESNNKLLTGVIQGKIQEAESFATRYRFEHERVRELEQLLARFRVQEHQFQLESKDSGAKNAIMRERLVALEEQVHLLQKSKDRQREEILHLEEILKQKSDEENRRMNTVSAGVQENLQYNNEIDPADSQSKVQELEIRTISLSADLTKTAALYRDCFSRLQKAEAQCAEQRAEYEHVLSILSKVDDDRIQLQQKCRDLVNVAEKKDLNQMVAGGQTRLDSILEQSEPRA